MIHNWFFVTNFMFSMLTTSVIILFFLIRSLDMRLRKAERHLIPDEKTEKQFHDAMDHLEAAMHALEQHVSGVRPS